MNRLVAKILNKVVAFSRYVAIASAGAASHWGGHQPKEPDMKCWKK